MAQKELFQTTQEGQPGSDVVLFGSSSFSEPDWVGPFYPKGTQSRDFLSVYASKLRTVEIDATYYAVPSLRTVESWRTRTPEGFLFSVKFPKQVVHGGDGPHPEGARILDSDIARATTDAFLENISALGEKLGVILIQFPYFNRSVFAESGPFFERMDRFLQTLPTDTHRFAVETRNKNWLIPGFFRILEQNRCIPALVDQGWMPHGDELAELANPLMNGWGYVRLIGDRREIEAITDRWDREVIDRGERLARWAKLLVKHAGAAEKIVVYVNNHFAGHSPATIRRLMELFEQEVQKT